MESLKANILSEDMIKMSPKAKKRIYFSHHRENEVSKSE